MPNFLNLFSLTFTGLLLITLNCTRQSKYNTSKNSLDSSSYTKVSDGIQGAESEIEDSINVLIVTGMDHPAHKWRKTTPALRAELTKDPRMKIDVLEDPYQLEVVELDNYDVVFLHFNNWKKPDPNAKAKKNLKQFVAQGGGLFLLHFACGAFRNWEEYTKIAGKVWDGENTHDPRGKFRVEIVNHQHPVTREMETYETDDELYIGVKGEKEVILLARARSKITKRYHPMAFAHTYGKGRVFNTPLGHDVRAIQIEGTANMIRNGVIWVAGRAL
ncbi:ThuA domain-containing protein [Halalkalibaculum sp. DA3122]|uniref:ThuA domain-containing protein n=1 Tax=unclassified Halalkalibaculum TaxID=2964617 RepID=UPI00375413B4